MSNFEHNEKDTLCENNKSNKKACKAILFFTPFLILIICFCILVLIGYNKFVDYSGYANLIFNKASQIENISDDNEYRSSDAPELNGSVTDDDDVAHNITYPYYGDKYATITIDNAECYVEDTPVYWGDSDSILDKGLGQANYSTYIGQKGRVVLAGHNHTYFRYLKNAKAGDMVTITTSYGTFVYEITETKILEYTDTTYLYYDPTAENVIDDLVMYTCYNEGAIGYTTQRFYVLCKVVSKEYNDEVK